MCLLVISHEYHHLNSVIPQLRLYKVGETAVKSAIALDVNTVDNPEWVRIAEEFPCRCLRSSVLSILDRCIDSLT